MEFYSKTDIGRVRQTNQDAVKTKSLDDDFIWSVVCDGMGGAAGGDVASSTAVSEITSYLDFYLYQKNSADELPEILQNAVQNANGAVFEKSAANKIFSRMGTTVVLCAVYGKKLYIVHVGDSRAYLIRDQGIKQLTKDHSIIQQMIDSGEITKQDAKNHPQRSIITRAVGVCERVELDYIESDIQNEDIILLCTDGLTNYLDDGEICKICLQSDFHQLPDKLVSEANRLGGNDNITVSVIKV